MANKYLDIEGVKTLWTAVKDRDDAISATKAGYIHYDSEAKAIQLWASEADYLAYVAAVDKTADDTPKPVSVMNAEAFVKDGMLSDVDIVKANEVGSITYLPMGSASPVTYTGDEMFIRFKWNVKDDKGNDKVDYVLLTEIAPVYTEGTGIDITNNVISFEGGKSNQIKTDKNIKLGGTPLANMLIEAGIKSIDKDTDLTAVLVKLLSEETWPENITTYVDEVTISNSGPSIKAYNSSTGNNTLSSSVEVGTKGWLQITAQDASGYTYRRYDGFTNGYSTVPASDESFAITAGDPADVKYTANENSGEKYSIAITIPEGSYLGTISNPASAEKAADVKTDRHEFTVKDGKATLSASQTTPGFTANISAVNTTFYGVSTLENTDDEYSIAPTTGTTKTKAGTTKTNNFEITGYRRLFYGSSTSNDIAQFTSDFIRAAAGGAGPEKAYAKGDYKPAAPGKKLFWVAFPSNTTTDAWKVTGAYFPPYTSNDMAAEFKSTTAQVYGANNVEATTYKIWYIAFASEASEADMKITIG
jgi:hypothetical protein